MSFNAAGHVCNFYCVLDIHAHLILARPDVTPSDLAYTLSNMGARVVDVRHAPEADVVMLRGELTETFEPDGTFRGKATAQDLAEHTAAYLALVREA